MKRAKKSSLTTQYVLAVGALLLVTNIIIGLVVLRKSTAGIQTLIRKNMLDISNTAAGLLDGDALGALTEEDVGGPVFNDVYKKLSVFQSNNDIEYIYAVRQNGPDSFVFTVDPDPVDPGDFGEPVLVTEAMRKAGAGEAAVDSSPAQDQWGNFYSTFSPVFDSEGQVAGIVGVDFDPNWFDSQVRQNTFLVGFLTAASVTAGAAVVLVISRRLRLRFNGLSEDLSELSAELDELMEQISLKDGPLPAEPESRESRSRGDQGVSNELEELSEKISSMQDEMKRYLDYVHAQAFTDALTQVGNTTAYMELRSHLEEGISAGSAAFGLAVFDINLLKQVNDRCGHTCGDRIIQAAAVAISTVFGVQQTYRIGGDEFLAVAYRVTEEEMAEKLEQVEECINRFNEQMEGRDPLSMSKGASIYHPKEDSGFQEVFVRADETMYRQKDEFHRQLGERGSRYSRLSD